MSDEEKREMYRALFLVNFLVCLGFGIADPFFSVYATSGGASGIHLALIFSGYAAAKILFSPVTGWWSDRKGRRRLLVSGLFLQSAVAFGYLFLPGPSWLIALRFLQGVAAAFIRPVSLAVVGDIAPERREGTAMGTFDISFYAALAVGPVLGGIVKDAFGFPGIFLSLFCLCLLALGTALFFVKNHGEEKRAAAPARIDWSVLKRSRTLIAPLRVHLRQIVRDRVFRHVPSHLHAWDPAPDRPRDRDRSWERTPS